MEAPGIATVLESAERIPVRSDERRNRSSLLRLEVEAPGIEFFRDHHSNAAMSLVFRSQVFDLPALPRLGRVDVSRHGFP